MSLEELVQAREDWDEVQGRMLMELRAKLARSRDAVDSFAKEKMDQIINYFAALGDTITADAQSKIDTLVAEITATGETFIKEHLDPFEIVIQQEEQLQPVTDASYKLARAICDNQVVIALPTLVEPHMAKWLHVDTVEQQVAYSVSPSGAIQTLRTELDRYIADKHYTDMIDVNALLAKGAFVTQNPSAIGFARVTFSIISRKPQYYVGYTAPRTTLAYSVFSRQHGRCDSRVGNQ